MIEISPESSIYKLIYNSSYCLLDICYHYFKPIFSVFIFFTNYVGFISHEVIIIWIFEYKSQISTPAVLCALPLEIDKRFSIKI